MAVEPHEGGILDKEFPYAAKSDVKGGLVCLLDARSEVRGLELVIHPSRAVLKNEIHELVITDDPEAAPRRVTKRRTINRVAFIGFFEVSEGGMILVGDKVEVEGKEIGHVAGFDETHFPNHINILLYTSSELMTGPQLGLKLGDHITFSAPCLPVE